ncbi:hypothetical protein ACFWUU_28395 [Kribbella sp. NPDC058693]|uniref:hypothetical protein n=1 Tax=Kribbella sp. NPDC058693 TaxID=3346602 RepID=UPI003662F8BA
MSRPRTTRAGLAAGAALLLMTALLPPAQAATTTAAVTCTIDIGSVTATGDHTYREISATNPPTVQALPNRAGLGVYPPGSVRLSSTFVDQPEFGQWFAVGWVIQGDVLSRSSYVLQPPAGYLDPPQLIRIGGGWTAFRFLDENAYVPVQHGQTLRTSAYGLRSDGTLFRWRVDGLVWRRSGEAAGFSAVKTMALISKTATYDTFLANTRGGALYTIRIPVSSAMKPVVTRVRTTTWQVFETLAAAKCGNTGRLLLGIDKNSASGYLYAVGHANGLATVIKGLGKVPLTFGDPVDFRWRFDFDPMNGD